MDQSSARHPAVAGAFWMLGSLTSFIGMAIAGRELAAARMGTFEILLFRSVIGLAIMSVLLTRSGWGQVSVRRFRLHLARNLSHFGGQLGWFYAISVIPLAEVFAIEFTTPMWTAIMAALLLRERVTPARVLAIALGITGVLIILRPGLAVIHPASLAVLGAAACYALTFVITRKLAFTDSALSILFYMTLMQLPLALVPAMTHWMTPPLATWLWLLVVGATGLSAHYCHTRALLLADATAMAPMEFLRLPLIAVAGLVFYGEALDWFVLAGAVVMVAGNVVNILAERARLQSL